LAGRWFFRDAKEKDYGSAWRDVASFCRSADMFLHVSGSCRMREEYLAASRVIYIDSDPMYTQASVLPDYIGGTIDDQARWRLGELHRHHSFFSFGENIGAPDCLVPTALFDWKPTRQPVVLDCYEHASVPLAARRCVATTVASWVTKETGPVVDGVAYGGKGMEFERFIDLPARSALPLELAMSGPAPLDRLRARGWMLCDGQLVSRDPWTYRDYLAHSYAEWSVAKNAYVAGRSGWFSCRTACYLAMGVPAVVQDTGFSRIIPSGDGVIAFQTLEEAADALARVAAEPMRHAAAARAIAHEYFDSDKVLTRLIENAVDCEGPATKAGVVA
jgi:hypothetical protein